MTFNLEKFFVDVFAPQSGDVVTVMHDLPHDDIQDNRAWQERREMAEEWRRELERFAGSYGAQVNPSLTYQATGAHNRDLPEYGFSDGKQVRLEAIIENSTIIIAMPQFSSSAPLVGFTHKYEKLRVASMPMVSRAMEKTALAADYKKIAETCAWLAPLFEQAVGIEVAFSTGHVCYFDISDHKPVIQDNGRLHPAGKEAFRLRNLPSGEVAVTPNEAPTSRTAGQIPVAFGDEIVVLVVDHNHIVEVKGDGPAAIEKRHMFGAEKALGNIAEVAIGCNDKAVVSGNILEDEKAGFHWAYGRSDHLGGAVGVEAFSGPDKVVHQDVIYAKGSPIVCQRLDFIFPDGARRTAIVEGVLSIQE